MKSTALRKQVNFFLCSLLLIFGVLIIWFGPSIQKIIIKNKLILTPDSYPFKLWKEFPIDVPMDFYFFNWTNPNDIYNSSVKPKFKELGPYRFMQKIKKSNVVWNKNGTVTYRQLRYWRFSDELVKSNLQDRITTVNPVALSTAHVARTWSYVVRRAVSATVSSLSKTIHMTRTVSQMLFEGYPDTLIKLAKTFPFFVDQELPPWDKFGWFYERNGSSAFEGVFNMGTGINSTLGKLYSWNYRENTSFYEGNCAKINDASAGELFTEYRGKKSLKFLCSDLCRTLTLNYVGQSTVNDIVGDKYVFDDYMLDNGTVYPENKCFCNGECLPSGVVNVSSCRFGSPAFGSLPHFYQADPFYTNLVEGLEPTQQKHEFFIILEPNTGIPLQVSVRLQINLMLQSLPGISMYEHIPRIIFPMIWFEQKASIPQGEIFALRLLQYLPSIILAIGILVIVFGLILFIYTIFGNYLLKSRPKIQYSSNPSEKISLKNNDCFEENDNN